MTKPSFEQTYYDLKRLSHHIGAENLNYDEDYYRMLLLDLIIEIADQLDQ